MIEHLAPQTLPPGARGEAIFRRDWNSLVPLATVAGAPFEMMEGQRLVGTGAMLEWLTDDGV